MAGKKKVATRRAPASGEKSSLSPAHQAALNIRLNGGVIDTPRPGSEEEQAYRAKGAEMVEVPRLDFTVIDHGRKVGPTDKPVEISYSTAVTLGLIAIDEERGGGRLRQKTLVTEPSKAGTAQADNGHGGEGNALGTEIPAIDLTEQPVTLDEIDETAEGTGRDDDAL